MRDYTKAIEVIQEAKDQDAEHKHTAEISQQEMKCQQALFSQRGEENQEETLQRAMRDPEVAVSTSNLLGDSRYLTHFVASGHHERSDYATDPTAGTE